MQWLDLFPQAALTNCEMTRSDHRPILMDVNYLRGTHGGQAVHKRRFEARWLQEDTVEEIIKIAWQEQQHMGKGPS